MQLLFIQLDPCFSLLSVALPNVMMMEKSMGKYLTPWNIGKWVHTLSPYKACVLGSLPRKKITAPKSDATKSRYTYGQKLINL